MAIFPLNLNQVSLKLIVLHEANCSKSDYVIIRRPTWMWKCWPGRVTGVACYGDDRFEVRGVRIIGEIPLLDVSVSNRLDTS